VSELRDGAVRTFYLHPTEAGVATAPVSALAGGTADDNAAIVTAVLTGEPGPCRDVVLLNAGAALLVAGAASTLLDGVRLAATSIDSGRARDVLVRLREVCAA
jgi:anthranilate phosphoribosyltransferase